MTHPAEEPGLLQYSLFILILSHSWYCRYCNNSTAALLLDTQFHRLMCNWNQSLIFYFLHCQNGQNISTTLLHNKTIFPFLSRKKRKYKIQKVKAQITVLHAWYGNKLCLLLMFSTSTQTVDSCVNFLSCICCLVVNKLIVLIAATLS